MTTTAFDMDGLEKQLQGLRLVLTQELPDQLRSGAVDPSLWRGAHEADTWLAANRLRLPRALAASYEELLRWFVASSNDFLSWMRTAIDAGRRGESQAESELRDRIEELWRAYDQRASEVMRVAALEAPNVVEPSVRILVMAANPSTTSALDLEEELRSIELELGAVRHRGEMSVIYRHAVRPDDLVRHLRQDAPRIVHFSGHGSRSGITLRTEAGHAEVTGAALARLFRDRGVELVVLNACFSEAQAKDLAAVVPAVVGTTEAVGDEAARRFSTAFYRTLGNGHPISEAFRDGGDAVAVHGLADVFCAFGRLDWTIATRGTAQ